MGKKPMDPFARRMIQGSFVYGGMMLLMFAVLTVIYLHTRPRCTDRVVAESTDPGKHWTATAMERRCGNEAPFFTHVNLWPVGTDLNTGFFSGSATEGEVFLIEQDAAGSATTLDWTSPATLSIHCRHCSTALLRKHDERWGNVNITYDFRPR
jgi:hypothetical protein